MPGFGKGLKGGPLVISAKGQASTMASRATLLSWWSPPFTPSISIPSFTPPLISPSSLYFTDTSGVTKLGWAPVMMPNIQSYIVQCNFNRYDNTYPLGLWYTYQSDISLNLIDPCITDPPYMGYGYIYRVGAVYTTGTAYSEPFNCPITYVPNAPVYPDYMIAYPPPAPDRAGGVALLVSSGDYSPNTLNVQFIFYQPNNENITSYIIHKQNPDGSWVPFELIPSNIMVETLYKYNQIIIFDAYPNDNYTTSSVLAYRVQFVNAKGIGPYGETRRAQIS